MNSPLRWNDAAAYRWEKSRSAGKTVFALRGALAFLAAGAVVALPLLTYRRYMTTAEFLEIIVGLFVVFPFLGILAALATWRRMEKRYRDYLTDPPVNATT